MSIKYRHLNGSPCIYIHIYIYNKYVGVVSMILLFFLFGIFFTGHFIEKHNNNNIVLSTSK